MRVGPSAIARGPVKYPTAAWVSAVSPNSGSFHRHRESKEAAMGLERDPEVKISEVM